ncbi:MAG TPA: hypothetical protein VKY73_03855 [Polyangiaceae bacterium]|nr:hypothetical protein [Polyangiaceae bacterium]
MRLQRLQLARGLTYAALFAFGLDLGGSLYEHLVIDTAWVDNPALIQPAQGGISRGAFWIPMHIALTVLLAAALWATFKERAVRKRVLWAIGLYAAMRIWTFAYFVPLALQFESLQEPVLSPQMRSVAEQWVRWSWLRLPFVAGAAIALWLAARRLDSLLGVSAVTRGAAPRPTEPSGFPHGGRPSPASR